jgi:hypothetical protein
MGPLLAESKLTKSRASGLMLTELSNAPHSVLTTIEPPRTAVAEFASFVIFAEVMNKRTKASI